jgi:glutaredoxin 3
MYTTAVCPYCIRAKQILKAKGVEQIEEIRVDLEPDAANHMMEITGRTHGAADFHRWPPTWAVATT